MPQPTATPLVSVFVPTYNGAEYVAESIERVLDQTYDNFELIVVDDGSSDATATVVETHARGDRRVKFFRKGVREGPCRARNEALARSQGPLLCWLDQDDIWMRGKLEKQVDFMSRHPDVGLVYSYFDAFDSSTGDVLSWPDGRRDFGDDALTALFLFGCFIGSSTTMFRRQVFRAGVPRLREHEFSWGDDYYLWLAIAARWRIACIPDVLVAYRRHASNESARLRSRANLDLARANLLCDFLAEFPDAKTQLTLFARSVPAYHLILACRFELARRRALRAAGLAARSAFLDPTALIRTRLGRRPPPELYTWYRANGLWEPAAKAP